MLLPQQLNRFCRHDRWDDAADWGLAECIECGCCDFVCPSHIPLLEWFRHGKSELRRSGIEKAQAQAARARFEAREARLQRIKSERKERIQAKKKALRDDREKQEEIAAAIERAGQRREPEK